MWSESLMKNEKNKDIKYNLWVRMKISVLTDILVTRFYRYQGILENIGKYFVTKCQWKKIDQN